MARTDILIAVHGAGQTQAIYMPRPCSTLIEILPQNNRNQSNFGQMYAETAANWLSFVDHSGCCGYNYNLTLDIPRLLDTLLVAKARWSTCTVRNALQ